MNRESTSRLRKRAGKPAKLASRTCTNTLFLLAGAKVDHQWVLTANQRLPQLVAAAAEEEKLAAQKAA